MVVVLIAEIIVKHVAVLAACSFLLVGLIIRISILLFIHRIEVIVKVRVSAQKLAFFSS